MKFEVKLQEVCRQKEGLKPSPQKLLPQFVTERRDESGQHHLQDPGLDLVAAHPATSLVDRPHFMHSQPGLKASQTIEHEKS